MSTSSFLSGKAFKSSLPFVSLPPPADAPRLKRLALAQGELAQFHDGEEAIHYIACIELRAGGVRGNHYHKIKKEWTYVIAGKLLLILEDIATHERVSSTMEPGDLAFIAPGIAHALRTIEPGAAVEFSQAQFNAEDIYPFRLEK
ncbi:MAG TPA: cupin domain-containing protein [Candidatus Acidoferrum sp.]|jgi:quercetin dioxygenase-like cupin family protein|nr:cupin domain-containing protein [Candidatus Acidoferrum sp.]